jgi:hemerythrin-like domain-containing protein
MTDSNGAAQTDVSDMRAVHQVLRDTLGCARARVESVDPDDGARRALISNYYENVLSFLHVHHDGEEILVFPRLRERDAPDAALVDAAARQHEDVLAQMGAAAEALAAWGGGDTGAQQRAADHLDTLHTDLVAHLDDEEQTVLPLCAEYITQEEWGQLPGHALGNFGGDKVWLILGLIRERMNDEQRGAMLANMPPPAVEMSTSFGEQAFKELSAEVG